MSNVSDIIEQFILTNIGDDSKMDLSRNELAVHFAVAPSQINYVLSTRFTLERGYLVEGKRGGGGYIRLIRLASDADVLKSIYDSVDGELQERQALHILSRLFEAGKITEREYALLGAAMSDKALSLPFKDKDEIRACIMRGVLSRLMQIQ